MAPWLFVGGLVLIMLVIPMRFYRFWHKNVRPPNRQSPDRSESGER